MLLSVPTHGRNGQTSTTAPRYLSLLKAEAAMDVVTAVAMGSEDEDKMQSLPISGWAKGRRIRLCDPPFSLLYSLVRANFNHLLQGYE